MLKIIIFILFFALIFFLRNALLPLFFGIIFAYILNPMVSFFELKLNGKRLIAIGISYLAVFGFAAMMIFIFADIAEGEASAGSIDNSVRILKKYYYENKGILDSLFNFSIENYNFPLLLSKLGKVTVKALIGVVASVYLLKDKEYFLRLCNKVLHIFLKQKAHGILKELLFSIDQVISSFIKGVLIDSTIVAALSSLALSIVGIDYSLFIGVFAGIANIIPYFGPVIGIIPALILALSKGGISLAILAALVLFVIQQIECNLIYPRIIGKSTGLHPLFVLLSVSVAGYFGGLLWMVLAVPIAGIIRVCVITFFSE